MPHREATWADLVPASKALAAGFENSELFGKYIHPYKDKYPNDMYLHFLRELRADYVAGPDHKVVVTYDATTNKITGCAGWIRKRATKPNPGIYYSVLSQAVSAYNYLESFIYPNRAAEPSRVNVLDRMEPYTEHHWSGTRAESWYLAYIAVDPKAERKGYGKELVKYGMDLARAEGVGSSVIAAAGRATFYEACGYDKQVGTTSDHGGEDNPLYNVETGTVHFWDNGIEPKGIKAYGKK